MEPTTYVLSDCRRGTKLFVTKMNHKINRLIYKDFTGPRCEDDVEQTNELGYEPSLFYFAHELISRDYSAHVFAYDWAMRIHGWSTATGRIQLHRLNQAKYHESQD